jgi:hypothetical protein
MKKVNHFALLPLLVVAATIAGCAAPRGTGYESYKTYGEQTEDAKIIARIRTNFRLNPVIPDHLIHLSIDRNIVQLSGFVRNHKEADLAILTAKSTTGVKDVINNMIVLSDPDYARRRGDAEFSNTRR